MLWLKSFEPRGDPLQALHRISLEHGTVFLCGAQRQQLQPAVRHPGTVAKVRIATPGPLVWVQATRQPLVSRLPHILQRTRAQNYGLRSLVREVVQSPLFLNK